MEIQPIITLPHTIRRCDGKPDHDWVQHVIYQCKQNCLSFTEKHDYGYIRLMVDAQEYMRITGSATDFTVPTKPARPNHAGRLSAVEITRADSDYFFNLNEFNYYMAVIKAMNTQIIDSVDEAYILDLKDSTLGWHKVQPKTITDHLLKHYGKVTSVEIVKIQETMRTPWHPNQGPPEIVFHRIQAARDATQYCTKGKITEDDATVTLQAIAIGTGLPGMKEAVRKFNNRPDVEQTYTNIKTAITDAYDELPAQDKAPVTSASAGYNSANNMEEKENQQPYPHYCWSHGVTWTERHTSKTCHANRRFPDHNEAATFYNMCGGCSKIMRRAGDRAIWRPKPRTNNGGSEE